MVDQHAFREIPNSWRDVLTETMNHQMPPEANIGTHYEQALSMMNSARTVAEAFAVLRHWYRPGCQLTGYQYQHLYRMALVKPNKPKGS